MRVYITNPDIVDRYARGQTSKQIGDLYGVSSNTIVRALRRAGINVPRPGRRWSRDEERLLMRLVGEKRSRNEIANLMGRSWSSVDSKIKRVEEVNNPELYMRRRNVWYGEAA